MLRRMSQHWAMNVHVSIAITKVLETDVGTVLTQRDFKAAAIPGFNGQFDILGKVLPVHRDEPH